jgi:hypothetical protein
MLSHTVSLIFPSPRRFTKLPGYPLYCRHYERSTNDDDRVWSRLDVCLSTATYCVGISIVFMIQGDTRPEPSKSTTSFLGCRA